MFHLRSNIPELAKHIMEDARPNFYSLINRGDFIVAGENFGQGSSREHAPTAFTARIVEGKAVRLEFDKPLRDRYGRLLAYVYLGGVMVNEELIRQGYSSVYDKYPFRYLERFKAMTKN